MKNLRTAAIGFLVSFIGSVPLGYLNVAGFAVLQNGGNEKMCAYLAGVITIEALVILATLKFARRLSENERLLRAISLFTIVFLVCLAVIFSQSADANSLSVRVNPATHFASFVLGLSLSAINFQQIPYWLGWNLFLNPGGNAGSGTSVIYVLSASVGTFIGMLAFIYSLSELSRFEIVTSSLNVILPVFFLAMAAFQSWKLYQKYKSDS